MHTRTRTYMHTHTYSTAWYFYFLSLSRDCAKLTDWQELCLVSLFYHVKYFRVSAFCRAKSKY